MKKGILSGGIIIILGLSLFILTGCGNSKKDDNNSEPKEQASKQIDNEKEKNTTSSSIKKNAGYRYTSDDGFGYSQIDFYDDDSVVLTNVETEKGVVQQCYGKYTIDGNNLTIKLSEEYNFRNKSRSDFPDGDWYLTIESDTEIKSERIHAGKRGRIYKYIDTLEKILN